MKPTGASRLLSCRLLAAQAMFSSARADALLPSPLPLLLSNHLPSHSNTVLSPAGWLYLLPFPDAVRLRLAPANPSRYSFAETGAEGTGRVLR